ncbi:MAG: hypothetical protein ACI9G1_001315 [Pirellulaceae bacterium]|jgi:hypothetical protein
MTINRRRLLELGISTSVLASLPMVGIRATESIAQQLLQPISDAIAPINKSMTGSLDHDEFRSLATLCHYVDATWELGADLSTYLGQLESDLGLKTSRAPSYLSEYRHAIELVVSASDASNSLEEAWTTLLFAEFDGENLASTKLGRARRLVFSEIIAHQIPISGSFKSFGLVNYRGHFGGPYTSRSSYRRGAI